MFVQMGPQQGVLQQGATEDKGENARMVRSWMLRSTRTSLVSHSMHIRGAKVLAASTGLVCRRFSSQSQGHASSKRKTSIACRMPMTWGAPGCMSVAEMHSRFLLCTHFHMPRGWVSKHQPRNMNRLYTNPLHQAVQPAALQQNMVRHGSTPCNATPWQADVHAIVTCPLTSCP
jgi:hypothetical protein